MGNKWQRPELTVLFRGRPEESVLLHCKHKSTPVAAPYAFHDDCNTEVASCTACQSNANRS